MTVGEKAPAPADVFDFRRELFHEDNSCGPNYVLKNEHMAVLDEISQFDTDGKVINDTAFRDYIKISSNELAYVEESIRNELLTPENITAEQARSIYYSIPSLVSMKSKPEVLQVVAAGIEKEVEQLRTKEYTTAILRTRRLASVHEELGVSLSGEVGLKHEEQALLLNQEVIDSDLEITKSPRKIHAIFSIYDIQFRRLARKTGGIELSNSMRQDFVDSQVSFYTDLANVIAEFRDSNLSEATISNRAGFIGELLVLGKLRSSIIDSDRMHQLEASQSFLRQDQTNHNGLPAIPSWLWSFDLELKRLDSKDRVPIEVKRRGKRGTPERVADSRLGVADSYLPNIAVILFQLGYGLKDYLRLAEDYCRGSAQLLITDEELTKPQIKAITWFNSEVDGQVGQIIQRLEAAA